MSNVNHIQLIGYLTEDVQVRDLPSGTSVTDLNVQVKSKFTKDDGSTGISTSFHTVTVWGQTAGFLAQYARRGSQVYITGRLKTDEWEDDQGRKKYKTKVVADPYRGVELLDPKTPLSALDESYSVAGGLNRVDVVGNLTKDPELRQTTGGKSVLNFSVATNRKWKDKESGELQEETEYHNVVVWGTLAEDAEKILKKGQRAFASGPLSRRQWETPDGEKRYTYEINADQVLALGRPANDLADSFANNQQEEDTPPPEKSAPAGDNDATIPEINYESEIKPEDLPF